MTTGKAAQKVRRGRLAISPPCERGQVAGRFPVAVVATDVWSALLEAAYAVKAGSRRFLTVLQLLVTPPQVLSPCLTQELRGLAFRRMPGPSR